MRRVLLVLGLAIAFLLPASTTVMADWSMAGGDAARTGFTTAETSAFPALLWTTPVPGPLLTASIVARNPGATWSGATVYAISGGTTMLNALNAEDGASHWSLPLSSLDQTPWTFASQGGLAADPGGVYVLVTQQNGALSEWRDVVFALDRVSGTEVWNASGISYVYAGPRTESAPLLARDLVVFGSADGHVRALQASTGAVVWDAGIGSPVLSPVTFLETGNALVGDFVLASSGDYLFALDVSGSANGDQGIPDPPGSGDVVWSAFLGGLAGGAALATPGAAFVATGTQILALHPAFGSTIWTQSLPAAVTIPLSLWGSSLVVGADDQKLRAFDTTDGEILWVRSLLSLGVLQSWLVSTPTRIYAGVGTSMIAVDPDTGFIPWGDTYGSAIRFASVSENATGRGTIYAGMSAPDRVVAFGGWWDLRADGITLTSIVNPGVFQASVDATVRNIGDENVTQSFRVWVNDTIQGVTTVLSATTVPYLRGRDTVTVSIEVWNFSTGTHTITLAVEILPGDRDPANNAVSSRFFASEGPPEIITVWSPGFWIGLIVVGVAGLGAGWLIAVANRRRERDAAEVVRSRQEPRP